MKYTNQILLFSYCFLALLGLGTALQISGAPPSYLEVLRVLTGITLVLYCVENSLERHRPLASGQQFIMFCYWPFTVPVFIVASGGSRGLPRALMIVVTLIATFLFPILVYFAWLASST